MAACGTQAAGQPTEPPIAVTATAVPPDGDRGLAGGGHGPGAAIQPGTYLTGPATLTVADNRAVVRLRTGQQVAVTLTPGTFFSWHVPAAAAAAVREVSASGGYPGQQPARAAFLASGPGKQC